MLQLLKGSLISSVNYFGVSAVTMKVCHHELLLIFDCNLLFFSLVEDLVEVSKETVLYFK